MDQKVNNEQDNPIEENQAQRIFTNHLISSNRRSYTNISQSQIIPSNLSLLMEKVITHILSEQLLDLGDFIQVDKCELELYCQKISIQQLKDLIFTQNSSNFHFQQLQHYQNFEKDLEYIKQQIDPRRLRTIILQCNKLVVTYKAIQLLVNKFKVQIYSNMADGELSRLQCYSILEKVQAEFQHLHKFHDLIKQKLAEKNEISQFLYYPIKDIYKQEIRKQFCQIFLQKEQQIKQKTEIQPTLTINRKLTTTRQSTLSLLRPTKHLASLSNDQKISDEISIRSKITQHFSSIDRRITNDQQKIKQISSLQKYQMKFNQSLYDTLTLKLFESIYVALQTNFLVNNVEEIFENYGEKINLNLLTNFQKQIKCQICNNIFAQIQNNHSITISEEICSKDIKKKSKQELKLIAELFSQEQLIKLQQYIHYVNKLTTEYINKLTNLIYQLLENNIINFDSLQIEIDPTIVNEEFKYKLYGQSLLMLKNLTNESIVQISPLSNFLSKTKFLEQSVLLYPFSQQVTTLNQSINQIFHQAQNEIVSNLLFETYICIQSKHIIDRRDQFMIQLNIQSKQILQQMSQIIQGKVLKQQIASYSSKKPLLFDLNEVSSTIEWLFDQHILKKHIHKPIEIIDEFSFFITQIISQIKAMFDEEFFNDNIKFNRISSQLQLFENYVKQEILKKPQDQQLKIQWSNKIFRLFHKINNELVPTSRATTRRKQTTEPKDQQAVIQSPMIQIPKTMSFKSSIYVKGNKTNIQNTERLTQSTAKIKEIEKKLI